MSFKHLLNEALEEPMHRYDEEGHVIASENQVDFSEGYPCPICRERFASIEDMLSHCARETEETMVLVRERLQDPRIIEDVPDE